MMIQPRDERSDAIWETTLLFMGVLAGGFAVMQAYYQMQASRAELAKAALAEYLEEEDEDESQDPSAT